MNWKTMKQFEPELARLEKSAFNAGRNQASWIDVLHASHESLSKAVGRGSMHEALQDSRSYEIARASLFASWSKGVKTASEAKPATTPVGPSQNHLPWARGVDRQATFIDVSEAYA